MKAEEIEAYKCGFMNGLEVKENHKYQLLGYDLDQILKVMGNYKMADKPKHIMTRAEAVSMLRNHMPLSESADRAIDFYIKAGMLEVVEEKKLSLAEKIYSKNVELRCSQVDMTLRAIAELGYKISPI